MVERIRSLQGEELANTVSHGFGLLGSIIAFPLLVAAAAKHGDPLITTGAVIFGISLVALYAASTVYHGTPPGERKEFWQRVDHAAIYFLIAGTYTPFTLGPLRGPWGWSLLLIVWGIAAFGMFGKICRGACFPTPSLSMLGYLLLGWMIVIAAGPLVHAIGWNGVKWLVGGGIAYTVGVIFCMRDEHIRGGHCVWHLFVLAGSLCHAIAVIGAATAAPPMLG